MKTIQESVESIIRKSPFIEEAIYDKLINVSSLARLIQPEVEKQLGKEIKTGAVMMAINRISPSKIIKIRKNISKIALDLGDFIVRSNLCDFTFKNTPTLLKRITDLLNSIGNDNDYFFTVSQGIFETNIVISANLESSIEKIFKDEEQIYKKEKLASVTVKLPKTNIEQSGVYYFILKQLAWADISVQEVISTTHEITIVVDENNVNEAFSMLMDLKRK